MAYTRIRDLLLGPSGDLTLDGDDLALVGDLDAVTQDVTLALGFFRGEWFADLEAGVPYLEEIMVKSPDLAVAREWLRRTILDRAGVRDVLALQLQLDSDRVARVAFRADTDLGELVVSTEIAA